MKTLIVLSLISIASLTYLSFSSESAETTHLEFSSFIQKFEADYKTSEEYEFRHQIFKNNLERYAALNKLNPRATFGVTEFSDRTVEELRVLFGGELYEESSSSLEKKVGENSARNLNERTPSSINWNSLMHLVRKNNGCGSWAFVTAAVGGARHAIDNNDLFVTDFSEQQLIDCVRESDGCGNGYPESGFRFWKDHDAAKEVWYRFTGEVGECETDHETGIRVSKVYKPPANKLAILEELHEGPIALGMRIDDISGYKEGVITQCSEANWNRVLPLIGWDEDDETLLFRESRGFMWGEHGNVRFSFDLEGCDWHKSPFTAHF